MTLPAEPNRFATIDALRGVAAIAVMLYHAGDSSPIPMPGGYLAVDLFFALSGFVIAHAYSQRLKAGMRFGTFMRLRLARLWPMLALGALLGIVLHGGHAGMLFLLPNPISPDMLYPANPPLWSLLLEMAAYAAFALLWSRIGARGVGTIIVCGAVGLTLASIGPYALSSFGAEWRVLLPGFARLAFGFGIGIVIWRLRCGAIVRRSTNAAWLLPLAFVGTAAAVSPANLPGLLVIIIVIPALTWLATCWEVPQRRTSAALGDLSYPLYCVHVPLIASAGAAGIPSLATLLLLPFGALWLDRRIDAPARVALKRLLMNGVPKASLPA